MQLKNPIMQFFLFLCVLLGFTVADLLMYESDSSMRLRYIVNLLVTLGLGFAYFAANYYVIKLPNVNIANIGITSLIIYLIVHPTSPWWMYVIVMASMFLGKLVVRYKNQPIFNPAGFGIMLGYLITYVLKAMGIIQETLFESWWGADVQFTFADRMPFLIIVTILLLPAFFVGAKRFNKLQHSIWYFMTYTVLYLLYQYGRDGSISNLWDIVYGFATGSFLFLAFVMVTEPKTSPILKDHQIYLGIAGGVILLLYSNIFPAVFPWFRIEVPTTAALLTLNLLTWYVKNRKMLGNVNKAVTPTVKPTQVVVEKK